MASSGSGLMNPFHPCRGTPRRFLDSIREFRLPPLECITITFPAQKVTSQLSSDGGRNDVFRRKFSLQCFGAVRQA